MDTRQPSLDAVFSAAIAMESEQARNAWLDDVCGEDAAFRQQIDRLLTAHFSADSLLDSPAVAIEATVNQPVSELTEQPGDVIGPYKLLQQIGEGGMGVVYMAEQKEPVKRRVALKIIKPGMDTRQVIARFEAERQALAMMDHPNIAKVLDGGATETGRPYFVMELVNGIPLTDYCDEQRLTPNERLELFVPVCQAVQHAHQKGVIHRDLKPGNILVAEFDHKAVPKVIDFGVAKATSQTLTEKTMFTQLGQIVGTLDYMSPEQAKRNQLDVDTRSDIYSLGVILYELLTGETPFDKDRLRSAAFDEMLQIIREEEPPRPSVKLSSSETLPSIAANRHVDPNRLSILIRGELDWIVMKALEKDRGRRYETASAFAADVQHYLNDEAVVACPPSAGYRFRKFARRNRVTMAVTTSALLALITVTIGSSVAAGRFRSLADERNRALIAETEATDAAREERDRAQAHFDLSVEAVDRMLTRLGSVDLEDVPQLESVQRRVLEDALEIYEEIARTSSQEPQAVAAAADCARVVGRINLSLGRVEPGMSSYDKSLSLWRQLVDDHPDNTAYQFGLARTLHYSGWHGRNESHLYEAESILTLLQDTHGQTTDDFLLELSRVFQCLADVLMRRGFDTSVNDLQLSESYLHKSQSLLNESDEFVRSGVTESLARQFDRLGANLAYRHQGVAAAGAWRQAVELQQGVIEHDGATAERRRNLVKYRGNLISQLSCFEDRIEEARTLAEMNFTTSQELSAEFPAQGQNSFTISRDQLARLLVSLTTPPDMRDVVRGSQLLRDSLEQGSDTVRCAAMAHALYQEGKYQEAIDWILESKRLRPEVIRFGVSVFVGREFVLSMAYAKNGDRDAALRTMTEANRIAEESNEMIVQEGTVWAINELRQLAEAVLRAESVSSRADGV